MQKQGGFRFLGPLILAHTCPLGIGWPSQFGRKGVGFGSWHLEPRLPSHPSPSFAHSPAVSQIWRCTGLPFICRLTASRSNTVGV